MKKITFWGRDRYDDTLVNQVLRGEKTVTCSIPVLDYGQDEEPTVPGDLVEVIDGRGNRRCVIRIESVFEIPFGDVTNEIVRGECAASVEEFKADHHLCWDDGMKKLGMELDDRTIIVVERFSLVK